MSPASCCVELFEWDPVERLKKRAVVRVSNSFMRSSDCCSAALVPVPGAFLELEWPTALSVCMSISSASSREMSGVGPCSVIMALRACLAFLSSLTKVTPVLIPVPEVPDPPRDDAAASNRDSFIAISNAFWMGKTDMDGRWWLPEDFEGERPEEEGLLAPYKLAPLRTWPLKDPCVAWGLS